jgi:hypothetical protein
VQAILNQGQVPAAAILNQAPVPTILNQGQLIAAQVPAAQVPAAQPAAQPAANNDEPQPLQGGLRKTRGKYLRRKTRRNRK